LKPNLSQLYANLPPETRFIFRTDGGNSRVWRSLLAYDPDASIFINSLAELEHLPLFLSEHSDKLCAGYFSYDLGLLLHDLRSRHTSGAPLAVFHAYDNWTESRSGSTRSLNGTVLDQSPALTFTPTVMQDEYRRNIAEIQDYIKAGDLYQINYTQRLTATSRLPSRNLYPALLNQHPAAHACYFEHNNVALHSLSPELFLHFAQGTLSTEPIKGTRPRGKTETEDELFRQQLLDSEKEQAELFMITDLLRNDLGKVCEIGSVTLDAVKELKKLPKVWHTYSHISGKLLSELTPLEAILTMLPGGSISGCPKQRALEVIDELEASTRGIYTGSMGYFHPDGDFSFNLAIRTLVQQGQKLTLGSGGGITIDSNWQAEWDELMVKVSTFE